MIEREPLDTDVRITPETVEAIRFRLWGHIPEECMQEVFTDELLDLQQKEHPNV